MKKGKLFLLIIALLIVAIQFIPVNRQPPPVQADMPNDEPVKQILRQSCYDCHSNETNWPWYSYVAPVSWLIAHDVREGRENLNFSEWANFNPKQIKYYKQSIWNEIDKNRMPIKPYLLLHPKARISETARDTIRTWFASPDSSAIAPL